MKRSFLVRYGIMSQVGRFQPERDDEDFPRGHEVIVRTERGLEIGEVLGPAQSKAAQESPYRLVRRASDEDRQRQSEREPRRGELLALCDGIFREGTWPIDLIDVEVLPARPGEKELAVVHYLGTHGLDTEGLVEILEARSGVAWRFQPAGRDEEPEAQEAQEACSRCGSTGSGGCGSSGGQEKTGCSSCALAGATRRKQAVVAD